MYQNDAQKCLTGEVRCSYVHLHTPRQINNQGKPKYSMTALIPKTDTKTVEDIGNAMNAAIEKGIADVWGGKRPPQIVNTMYDGDGVKPETGEPWGPECKGHWVLRMSANEDHKPQVVGMDNIHVELDPRDVYSGMYARVTLRFYPYKYTGKCGIGCGLGNVLKTRDGDPLTSSATADSDFAGIGGDGSGVTATQGGGLKYDPITGLPM